MDISWDKAQRFEKEWHGNCILTYREQLKQEVYIEKMGLNLDYPNYDLRNKSVVDIGAGDCSILLRYKNKKSVAIDPLMDKFPKWVRLRYKANNITPVCGKGENLPLNEKYDIGLLYNCLQHAQKPKRIAENLKKTCKEIRVFEWVEEPISPGHIYALHEKELNKWFGGYGKVEKLNDRGCVGLAYFGVFLGDNSL